MKASRPTMPGYGIQPAAKGGLLPWSVVSEQMSAARNYWVSTVREDGRPHAAPVWGLWYEDSFFFSTGTDSRKARNLAANAAAVVHLESGDDAIILEGQMEIVSPEAEKKLLATLDKLYKAKYAVNFLGLGNIYRFRVEQAFAWKEANFPQSATRWQAE